MSGTVQVGPRPRQAEAHRGTVVDSFKRLRVTGHAPVGAGIGQGDRHPPRQGGAHAPPRRRLRAGSRELSGRVLPKGIYRVTDPGHRPQGNRSKVLRTHLPRQLDLVHVADVGHVVAVGAGLAREPGVQDLLQEGLAGAAQGEREHVRIVPPAGPPAVPASAHSAARTPATLFAAIDAPVPVQQTRCPGRRVPPPRPGPRPRWTTPVRALAGGQRAVQERLVAQRPQALHQGVRHARALVG